MGNPMPVKAGVLRKPERALEEAGFVALEPCPDDARARWLIRCATCGRRYRRRLVQVYRGTACRHSRVGRVIMTDEEIGAELHAAGYAALTPYPGAFQRPWPVVCRECLREQTLSFSLIRSGERCGHPDWEAEATVERAGYLPLEPFPGGAAKPWRLLCLGCGRALEMPLGRVRPGGECRHDEEESHD